MILKVFAALIFFYICVLFSHKEKDKLKYKYEYLMGIINALNYLKKEIMFFSTYLGDALINAAEYGGVADKLFENSGSSLINNSSTVLEDELLRYLEIDDLRIKLIIKELGTQLGTSDAENEEVLIENTVIKLTEILNEYKNDYYEKGKLISKTGILGGMFLAILIL